MIFRTITELEKQIGQRKPLAYFNTLKMDDYIRAMWHYYGIMIHDSADYNGFVRKNSRFDIYIPKLKEDHHIYSFKESDCDYRCVRVFPDVKRTINLMYHADPDRFRWLYINMWRKDLLEEGDKIE